MTREIKFKYLCVRENGHMFSTLFTLNEIEVGMAERWGDVNIVGTGNLHKLQFTGLKDKNGKEIYEGDIIAQRGQQNRFVEYDRGKWVLRNDEKNVEWRQDLHNKFYLHIEVIGNIYENPELLSPISDSNEAETK